MCAISCRLLSRYAIKWNYRFDCHFTNTEIYKKQQGHNRLSVLRQQLKELTLDDQTTQKIVKRQNHQRQSSLLKKSREGFFGRMEKWVKRYHLYSTAEISCTCFLRVPVTFLLEGIKIFLVLMSMDMCNFQCIELIVDRVLKRFRP